MERRCRALPIDDAALDRQLAVTSFPGSCYAHTCNSLASEITGPLSVRYRSCEHDILIIYLFTYLYFDFAENWHMWSVGQKHETIDFDTIRYDSVYLTCSKKPTGSQLSLPHGINKKIKM